MSLETEMATAPQIAQFGLLVAQQVVEKMRQKQEQENPFSKKEMNAMLEPPYNLKIKEMVSRIANEVFEIKNSIPIPTIHQRHIDKLTKYWKEKWNHHIEWASLIIPEQPKGLNVLEYEPGLFTEDEKLEIYKKNHSEDSVWCYYHTQNLKVRDSIKTQGTRPNGPYLYWHAGGQEPDKKHLNDSYNMFSVKKSEHGTNFAIPTEGITMADRYRCETSKMMDIKGLTRFDALDHDGDCMLMCECSNGEFRIDRHNPSSQYSNYGPREVSF